MSKLIAVENDEVTGTDTHTVSGTDTTPASATYSGTGDYDYAGKMTDLLSDFVKVDGKPVALKSSQSTLNPGETTPLTGAHSAPAGKNFNPSAPAPNTTSLQFLPPITGKGTPSASSGSSFVKVGGVAILLHNDKIDTCDGTGHANSTVTAQGQDFISCSE